MREKFDINDVVMHKSIYKGGLIFGVVKDTHNTLFCANNLFRYCPSEDLLVKHFNGTWWPECYFTKVNYKQKRFLIRLLKEHDLLLKA